MARERLLDTLEGPQDVEIAGLHRQPPPAQMVKSGHGRSKHQKYLPGWVIGWVVFTRPHLPDSPGKVNLCFRRPAVHTSDHPSAIVLVFAPIQIRKNRSLIRNEPLSRSACGNRWEPSMDNLLPMCEGKLSLAIECGFPLAGPPLPPSG